MRIADPEPVELWLGAQTLAWGLWAVLPWGHATQPRGLYRAMLAIASTEIWGGMFVAIGLATLVGVIGRWHSLRRHAALAGTMAWTLAWVAFAFAEARGQGSIVHAFPVLASCWVYLRLRR